jgi:hypothetical protein
MLVVALGVVVAVAAPAHSAAVATKPHGLKVLINGKRLTVTLPGAQDRYNPIKTSKIRISARWQGNLAGSGYRVVIATVDHPPIRTWRTCTTGTSCSLAKAVPILKGQEQSWLVTIVKKKPHLIQIIGNVMVCLIRNAKPA